MTNRKIILLFIGILCFQFVSAQDESDALRYSFLTPGGSARLQGIGGAGVSLGGEPSMVNTNPAAIGMFKTSDLSLTANLKTSSLSGSYLGQTNEENKVSFSIPQIELILASGNNKGNSKWANFSFGIGLNRLADFNQNIFYKGDNSHSSYADQYLNQLDKDEISSGSQIEDMISNPNLRPFSIYPNGIYQAYDTYLIDPPETTGSSYWTSVSRQVIANGGELSQSNMVNTKGGINEFSLAFAGNYNNRLIIGGGLFVPSINFDKKKNYQEKPTKDDDILIDYNIASNLHTDGVGINGKFGVIYIINKNWRAGASIHTPTYYSMHDSHTSHMKTNTNDKGLVESTTENYTEGYPIEYDYSLTTPWRAMGGLSYIFGSLSNAIHNGFITLDYEFVDYTAASFHFNSNNSTAEDKEYANDLNNNILDMYKGASNIRLGAELKFNILSTRAGVSYMGSPYENSKISGAQMQYSLGVGIRNKGFYADLSYVYIDRGERINQPYTLRPDRKPKVSSPPPAIIDGSMSNVLLTIGFKL